MVRIKLVKGLSYSGIVTATKKNPFVTTDEETAKEAVATGYFTIEEVIEEYPEKTGEDQEEDQAPPTSDDKVQKPIEKMTKPELEAYAKANGIDISSCTNNEQRIALIKEVEEKKEGSLTPDFTQE